MFEGHKEEEKTSLVNSDTPPVSRRGDPARRRRFSGLVAGIVFWAEYLCSLAWYQEWLLPTVASSVSSNTYRILDFFGLAAYGFKFINAIINLKKYLSNRTYYDFDEHIHLRRRRLDKALFVALDLGLSVAAGFGYILGQHASWALNCFIALGVIYYIRALYSFLKNLDHMRQFKQAYNKSVLNSGKQKLTWRACFFGPSPFGLFLRKLGSDELSNPTGEHFQMVTFFRHRAKLQKSIVDITFLSIMAACSVLWIVQPAAAVVVMITLGLIWTLVRKKYEKRSHAAKSLAKTLSANYFHNEDEHLERIEYVRTHGKGSSHKLCKLFRYNSSSLELSSPAPDSNNELMQSPDLSASCLNLTIGTFFADNSPPSVADNLPRMGTASSSSSIGNSPPASPLKQSC